MKKYFISSMLLLFTFSSFSKDIKEQSFKYHKLLTLLNSVYVDTVNIEEITEKAIVNTLEQLDPHSIYLTPEELKEENEVMSGEFSGIGIQFNILRDTLLIIATIPGGPSEEVGLRAGDRIIQIDEENVAGVGLTNSGVSKRLRGKKGTNVTVHIKREGEPKLLDFHIKRDRIPIHTVDASYIIRPQIGYIKLNRFGGKTTDEFREGLTKLLEQGMKKLIIDLTGNGGGYLRAAVEILDELLDDRRLLVYVEGEHSPKKDFNSYQKGMFESGDIVVLIDETSASASEILAGAIQDWDRGVVIGRRSFGKGLVQNQFSLPDNSAVRITTGHYYTPTGRNIQKHYKGSKNDYYSEVLERYGSGELVNADSVHFPDSLKFETLNNKRTVYGGGGIMPDVFVPIDTTKNYKYLNTLYQKNIVFPFVMDYMDKNRNKLEKQYPNLNSFKNSFVVSDKMIEKLVKEGDEKEIEKTPEQYEDAIPRLKLGIKALIARSLWEAQSFYEVTNETDLIVIRAIEILEKENLDSYLQKKSN